MQQFVFFWLSAVPIAVIVWFASGFILTGDTLTAYTDFNVTSLFESLWPLILDAFITTWVSLVVTSVLDALFIRFTASSPGLCPARGLRGALLMYRVNRMNAPFKDSGPGQSLDST